jgi:hypothetical protein
MKVKKDDDQINKKVCMISIRLEPHIYIELCNQANAKGERKTEFVQKAIKSRLKYGS